MKLATIEISGDRMLKAVKIDGKRPRWRQCKRTYDKKQNRTTLRIRLDDFEYHTVELRSDMTSVHRVSNGCLVVMS
jgi:hypothetical protein